MGEPWGLASEAVRAFTAEDAWSFNQGTHIGAHDVLGAHHDGGQVTFRVWAPSASAVAVVGDFNDWTPQPGDGLEADPSGVWRITRPGEPGQRYKFAVTDANGNTVEKADPYAFATEEPPRTASVIAELNYQWNDQDWMSQRGGRAALDAPISIYEVHLGSWRYEPGGYRALGSQLAAYAADMGFTHVELLPITEHPFYGSWGYQTTGYFAPTSRYGSPTDLMAMIDELHNRDIGVILDWVPSHFPTDEFGLARFDGSHLYEHADPRLGHHPDWDSAIFNYERNEVRSFLLSSAHFWAEHYHIDGIRVDAVASMLYRDYSRADGDWIPNEHGGNENLGAITFLQELNRTLYLHHPGIQVMAEESTAWPGVTRPVDQGGLGFGFKWDMGWMHDTLQYVERDPIHRTHHHNDITFRAVYRTSENYVLPLSHDEVVHGKGSLLDKMPGDYWQQLANLRLLLAYQWTTPGKKLLFMGSEFGQSGEWNHEAELSWFQASEPQRAALSHLVTELNRLYRSLPALHGGDCTEEGFEWIVGDDGDNSVIVFNRRHGNDVAVVAANFTPVPRPGYRFGVDVDGQWQRVLNSDDATFGGASEPQTTGATVEADLEPSHGRSQSLLMDLPGLSIQVFVPVS